MITERVMPIAMILLFILIGINGFITATGQLPTSTGYLSDSLGGNIKQLSSDIQGNAGEIELNETATSNPTSGTDTGFDLFKMVSSWWDGAVQAVTGTVQSLLGIAGLNLLENMLFGLEKYMDFFSTNFSLFSPIFNAVKYFAYGIKLLVFFYASSVLVRGIVGRQI